MPSLPLVLSGSQGASDDIHGLCSRDTGNLLLSARDSSSLKWGTGGNPPTGSGKSISRDTPQRHLAEERTVGLSSSRAASGFVIGATAALRAVFNNRYFKIPKPTSCYICSHTEVYSVLITLICCFISRCVMPTSVRARREQNLLSKGFVLRSPKRRLVKASQRPRDLWATPAPPRGALEAYPVCLSSVSLYIFVLTLN